MFLIPTASLGFVAFLFASAIALPLNLAAVDANDLVARYQGELQGRALDALSDIELFLCHAHREMRQFYTRTDPPKPSLYRVIAQTQDAIGDAYRTANKHRDVQKLAEQIGITASPKHETHIEQQTQAASRLEKIAQDLSKLSHHDAKDLATAARALPKIEKEARITDVSRRFAGKKLRKYPNLR